MDIKQLKALSHWTEKYKVVPSINQKLWLSNIAAVASFSLQLLRMFCSKYSEDKTQRVASRVQTDWEPVPMQIG